NRNTERGQRISCLVQALGGDNQNAVGASIGKLPQVLFALHQRLGEEKGTVASWRGSEQNAVQNRGRIRVQNDHRRTGVEQDTERSGPALHQPTRDSVRTVAQTARRLDNTLARLGPDVPGAVVEDVADGADRYTAFAGDVTNGRRGRHNNRRS